MALGPIGCNSSQTFCKKAKYSVEVVESDVKLQWKYWKTEKGNM